MSVHVSSGQFQSRWVTACPDWEDRIINRLPLVPDLPLFDKEAERALRIFKRLRVPDVFGNPTYGEVCDEWTFSLVRAIFGSYDPETKRRMIREFFLLIPKKNGKSSIAAAIMVTAAILNQRPEAELLMIAPTKKIADIAFKQAHGIIRLDKELVKLFHPQVHQRTLTHRISRAVIMIKAAEADTITGSKATYILIDETHVFATRANAADIFVEIRGSLASRPDGFLIQITTQSKKPPAGVFKAELDIAREVRDGKLSLPLLPVLYELPIRMSENGGWMKPETWALVNPNLNRSVDEGFLADEITKAEREGKAQLALIASQHFNVQIGMGNFADRWRGADYWEAAAFPTIADLSELLRRSEVVTVGVDMGGTDDLLGLAIIGREIGAKRWLLWNHAWAVPSVEETRKSIAATLNDFEDDQTLTVLPTLTEVVVALADKIEEIFLSGKLPERAGIGFDAWGTKTVISELEMRGIHTSEQNGPIIGVSQGVRLSSAILTTEWRLREGTLVHADLPMMNWCVGNAKAVLAGSNWKIEKAAAGTAKIDPLIATFNAVSLMDFNPVASAVLDVSAMVG